MSVFAVPDLGEGLTEVQIVAWHVGPGDHVTTDQPLVSVETDKALVEIPAPAPGTVVRTFGAPGDVLDVGAPLMELAEQAMDPGTVVGSLPAVPSPTPTAPPAESAQAGHVAAAPAVRHRAATLGVDLSTVRGTGPGGAPTVADVESAAGPDHPPATPLRGVRRAMAANMTRAGAAVVPATVTDDADVDAWSATEDVTVRAVHAVAAACTVEPALNAWYLGPEDGVVRWPAVHLGVAVDTDDGLVVPVLRDAGGRAPSALRMELTVLTEAARARRAAPEHLRGATFTLSNFGTVAGRHGALVVVPPQVAILGVGRLRDAVVARDGAAVVHRVLPLSLTFDHRVVTGGEAARFLAALITDLERPSIPDEPE